MTQYLVTTEKGKITASEPTLPISAENIHWLNEEWLGTQFEGLQTLMNGLVFQGLEVISYEEDIVQHLILQV